jgi:hypothetical protein
MLTSRKRGAVVPTTEDKGKAEDQVKINYRAMITHNALLSLIVVALPPLRLPCSSFPTSRPNVNAPSSAITRHSLAHLERSPLPGVCLLCIPSRAMISQEGQEISVEVADLHREKAVRSSSYHCVELPSSYHAFARCQKNVFPSLRCKQSLMNFRMNMISEISWQADMSYHNILPQAKHIAPLYVLSMQLAHMS